MFDAVPDTLPTRERLIATAASLLRKQSYGFVSVDDICKATGVQKGTFYHHFPSKVELALAAYDYMWTFARTHLDPIFSPTVPPLQRLENFAAASYAFHKECFEKEGKIYGCPITSAGHEMGAQDDRIRMKTMEIFEYHVAYFESVARDLPQFARFSREKLKILASEMFSYDLGVLYQAKIQNDPEVIRKHLLPGLKKLIGV